MADLQREFLKFYDEVRLSSHISKKDSLITSRDSIRTDIQKYFKDELKEKQPSFFEQGSFKLKTTVIPIEGEYDVDDGVYLNNLPDDFGEWPDVNEVHAWIYESVKDRTNEKPEYKNNCIRVVYARNYHVDLPIYGVNSQEYYLASKKEGWVKNDPKGFVDWFYNQLKLSGEQMRRNIIYLKAWADYNSYYDITGILITTLVAYHHVSFEERDDQSLYNTLNNIVINLKANSNVSMPVLPYDNLLSKYSDSKKEKIIEYFENFKKRAFEAIEEEYDNSFDIWNEEFGDRFVKCTKDVSEDKKEMASTIFINTEAAPKAWQRK